MVNANCGGSCNASVQAKATCTEPKLAIGFTGTVKAGAEGQFNTLITTLENNLPKILVVFKAQGQNLIDSVTSVVSVGGDLTASGKLDAHGVACIAAIGPSIQAGLDNFSAAFTAAGQVAGTVQ